MAKRGLRILLLVYFLAVPSRAASTTLFYAVTKGQRFFQTNANPPSLQISPQAPYRARAFLYANAATTASVKTPFNAIYTLTLNGDHMEYSKDYTVQAAMNNEWGNGNFTFTITSAADGAKNSIMQLSSDFYPAAPRISNFADAQAVDAAQPFTLTWDSLQRPAQEFAYLRIELDGGLIFESAPIPGTTNSLNGTSTSATIPKGRLVPGEVYACSLTSWRTIARDTNSIPGAQGATAYTMETSFPLRTRFATNDVRQYGFEKRVNYEQTAGPPTLRANPYEVIAFVNGARSNSVLSAAFKNPGGTQRTLTASATDYFSTQSFATVGAMDPAGIYEINISTASNGAQTNRLNFTASDFPGTLQIANLDQAQYVKPASPFTLFWTSPDGAANDLMQLIILDGAQKIFETPAVINSPGWVNGSVRSIPIPANTLASGKTYIATLRIFRPQVTDTFTYPGAIGTAGYSRLVRFPMKTASGPTPPPLLELPRRINNQTELRFSSIRGEIYRIQSSTNVSAWNNTQTLTASDITTTWLSPSSTMEGEFFRIIAGP